MNGGDVEFMTNKEAFDTLVEIKVSLATLSEQYKQLTDMRSIVEETRAIAKGADTRSLQNEKDITQIRSERKYFATKEEVEDVEKDIEDMKTDKRNWWNSAPRWVGSACAVLAFLLSMYAVLTGK